MAGPRKCGFLWYHIGGSATSEQIVMLESIMHTPTERISFSLFALYVALIPGSALYVARDIVPEWGRGFGGLLLLLQGAAMLGWLTWRYRQRGILAGFLIAALGFVVEYIGATTGFPFGRYTYTELVQPQLLGTVPVAICAAWMMVVASAYEIANQLGFKRYGRNGMLLVTATLVLILDLQIEPVAALINGYWHWHDSGPYYGVPTANFVAWWLVGLAMAWLLTLLLPTWTARTQTASPHSPAFVRGYSYVMQHMPALLYLLSTVMFTVVNLARGYLWAGAIGLAVLLVAGVLTGRFGGVALRSTVRRRYD